MVSRVVDLSKHESHLKELASSFHSHTDQQQQQQQQQRGGMITARPPFAVVVLSGKRKCGKDYITDRLVEKLRSMKKKHGEEGERRGAEGEGSCVKVVRLSAPIKEEFARRKKKEQEEEQGISCSSSGLSASLLNVLLSDGPLKEKYRKEMIEWGEQERERDPFCFCEAAVRNFCSVKDSSSSLSSAPSIMIVSDARRETDLVFFEKVFGGSSSNSNSNNDGTVANASVVNRLVRVRVEASESVRAGQRGWVFTQGVDDAESECGLDHRTSWEFVFDNSYSKEDSTSSSGDPSPGSFDEQLENLAKMVLDVEKRTRSLGQY
eukprot:Nk52_evm21s147 gene=Nk52_evmTU21s147